MNKIKIVDLLNKIANGEEVPQEIKYKNIIRYFDEETQDYLSDEKGNELFLFFNVLTSGTGELLKKRLNDEVEVVEKATLDGENDLISLIPHKQHFCFVNYDPDKRDIVERIYKNEEKINEIIKKVNKMQK